MNLPEAAAKVPGLDDHLRIDTYSLGLDLKWSEGLFSYQFDPVYVPKPYPKHKRHHDAQKKRIHLPEESVATVRPVAQDYVGLVHIRDVFLYIVWIELPVGGDDHHPGELSELQPGLLAAAITDVEGVVDDANLFKVVRESVGDLAGSVPAAVVDYQELIVVEDAISGVEYIKYCAF